MAGPIYKVFLAERYTEAWYQLSEGERDSLSAKMDEALEKVGGKRIIECNSAWSSEHWVFFGVEEFPDIEAVQKYTELLGELEWYRYLESMSALGTQ